MQKRALRASSSADGWFPIRPSHRRVGIPRRRARRECPRTAEPSTAAESLLGDRRLSVQPQAGRFGVAAGGAIAAAALLDESARTFWLDHHSSFASSLADAGDF